jgi:hypothetical protein
VNLTAPAPHTADGKPDLTGVWMHERTTPEEIKRIFGTEFEAELEASPIGMEAGTQHKYAMNILIDMKMYSRKFSVKISYNLVPDNDIFEMFCTQNEKDRAHGEVTSGYRAALTG